VVVGSDAGAAPVGAWRVVRGAAAVAEQVLTARSGLPQQLGPAPWKFVRG
jgi:hypothetical protein